MNSPETFMKVLIKSWDTRTIFLFKLKMKHFQLVRARYYYSHRPVDFVRKERTNEQSVQDRCLMMMFVSIVLCNINVMQSSQCKRHYYQPRPFRGFRKCQSPTDTMIKQFLDHVNCRAVLPGWVDRSAKALCSFPLRRRCRSTTSWSESPWTSGGSGYVSLNALRTHTQISVSSYLLRRTQIKGDKPPQIYNVLKDTLNIK